MSKNANEINKNFRIAEYKKIVMALSELSKKSPMESAMDKEEKESFEGLVRVILGYGFKAGFDNLAGVCEEVLLERRIMNRILHPEERSCEFYNSLSDEEKMYFLSSVYDNYYGTDRMNDYEEIEHAVNEAMCDMKGDDYDD